MRNVAASDFCKLLSKRKMSLFGGAGISYSSGLPIANALLWQVLEMLPISGREAEVLISSEIPFEAVFEKVSEHTDPTELLRIFRLGHPCGFHKLAATLANLDRLDGVMTTNFDLLFETALKDSGIRFHKRIEAKDPHSKLEVVVTKIHGCATSFNDLAITLRRVANQIQFSERSTLLKDFFDDTSGVILIAGYSCSDKFDITPILTEKIEANKRCIFVEHDASFKDCFELSPLSSHSDNAFSRFNGFHVRACTDSLIAGLQENLGTPTAATTSTKPSNWRTHVRKWANLARNSRGAGVLHVLAAELFRLAGELERASDLLNQSETLGLIPASSSKAKLLHGDVLREVGQFRAAYSSYKSSYLDAKKTKKVATSSRALNGMGMSIADQKSFKKAICFYASARLCAEGEGEELLASTIDGNWAISLKNLGGVSNCKTAFAKQKKTINTCRRFGDTRSEGRAIGNLGILYSNLGRKGKAIQCYQRASSLAQDLGDPYHRAIWKANEGIDRAEDEALEGVLLLETARNIFASIGSGQHVHYCDEKIRRLRDAI